MMVPLDGGTPQALSTQPFTPGPFAMFLQSDFFETVDQRVFTDLSFPVWADMDAGVIWGAPDGVARPLTAPDAGVFPSQMLNDLRIFDAARAELVGPCDLTWLDGGQPLQLCDQAAYPSDVILLSPGFHFTDGGSVDSFPR
jgi:hypothetical protein